jgi:hypothetical protein
MQDARYLHALAQHRDALFERLRLRDRHRLDVAADAERPASALEQHGADRLVLSSPARRLDEAARHVRMQRVAAIRPVHRDGEQAVVERLQDHVGHRGVSCCFS